MHISNQIQRVFVHLKKIDIWIFIIRTKATELDLRPESNQVIISEIDGIIKILHA